MITEIVTFRVPKGISRNDVLEDARKTIDRWQNNPDLVRKMYLMSDANKAKGIYLWKSKKAALKGHDEAWMKNAEHRWGARPTIEYFDTLMILDNRYEEIIEIPEPES